MILLEGVPGIQPVMGTWGTLTSFALNLALAFIAWRGYSRAKTAEAWESTARAAQTAEAAAKSEMETHKERARRLEAENMKHAEEVGRLKAMTDLSSLSMESSEQHAGIVMALKELSRESSERHAQLSQMMAEQTKMFLGLQTHTAQVFEHIVEDFRAVKAELDKR